MKNMPCHSLQGPGDGSLIIPVFVCLGFFNIRASGKFLTNYSILALNKLLHIHNELQYKKTTKLIFNN